MACKLCGNPAFENVCENCAKESFKTVEAEDANQSVEVPIPKAGYQIDKDQVKLRWNENETSPEIAQIKEKIVDAVERVSFEDFQAALERSIEAFNQLNAQDQNPYLVLFDYKPHASKYWTYGLAKDKIATPPQAARHFSPSFERMDGYTMLDKEVAEGIKRFAIFDDAIYSGEQVFNRAIKPIAEYFKQREYGMPQFDLVIPYVTSRFLASVEQIKEKYGVEINVLYQKIMPTLKEIMSDADRTVVANRGGMMDEVTEEITYTGSTVTYFDHRMADNHSFSEEIREAAGNMPIPKPYADESTEYYKQEEAEFEAYKRNFVP